MRLKELRKKYSISQTELATIAKTTQRCISSYENGTAEPGITTLKIIADYFHVSIDELVGHEVPYLIDKSLLSEKQINVINLIQKLSDHQCDKVESFIMGLSMAELERQQTIDKFNNRGE